ncbi:MAG: ATP-binding cassette domain-containing protein [Cellulomonas sp.]|uniref:ABC transporter ATP-binding protein n=2 Tax=Cellulomonas gelida TaxID=1712 RepID=UPI0016629853|nr:MULTISPECIES: ATP-binding cassette domain-containing protein [Cellulomonas]MCR6646768.1 ATP-binding cassette domain-containing protein [Cellulomonas sp.]GGL30662.1 ABC transporter ATP-binding protein [Cellulomonas gelida]
MTEPAISTRGLRKTYRRFDLSQVVAVEGLDLDVPAGGVHGFLGPNGSGKTTTIRMLLGLARPDAGQIHLFGRPVPERLPEVVGRIGAIVEQPKFVPMFSARRNLRILATAIEVPETTVEDVLERVGLRERARDPFRRFSLGMKQRLAIAATLLKDPDLLIFDEPTNGLDPAGIREIRETMRALADEGRTVLVSSHILAEVEQVADTVSIVARGRLVAAGAVGDLVRGRGQVRVGVADVAAAVPVLTARGWTVQPEGDGLLVGRGDGARATARDTGVEASGPDATGSDATGSDVTGVDAARVNEVLAGAGVFAHEIRTVRADLESVFLELTADVGVGGTQRRLRSRSHQETR